MPRRWLTSMLTREYTSIEIEEESKLARRTPGML